MMLWFDIRELSDELVKNCFKRRSHHAVKVFSRLTWGIAIDKVGPLLQKGTARVAWRVGRGSRPSEAGQSADHDQAGAVHAITGYGTGTQERPKRAFATETVHSSRKPHNPTRSGRPEDAHWRTCEVFAKGLKGM